MKWIKYQYICSIVNGEEILLEKKIVYSEENLTIAEAEAYNGQYEILDDEKIEIEPLGIEFGGTGGKTPKEALLNLGASKAIYGSYEGTGEYGTQNSNMIPVDFPPKVIVIQRELTGEVNVITMRYYENEDGSIDESYADSSLEVVASSLDCGGTCEFEYENGILSWRCKSATMWYFKANTDTGIVSKTNKSISTNENKADLMAWFQLNDSSSTYVYGIFG